MLLRQLTEADGKTAVFAFGRMNPPTIGHAKLVNVIVNQPGNPFLFLSHTQKPKTDPLSFAEKVFLLVNVLVTELLLATMALELLLMLVNSFTVESIPILFT